MKFSEKKYDTRFIIPERVIFEDKCTNAHVLLKEKPRQIIPYDRESIVLEQNGSVVIDFGTEIHGGLLITVNYAEENSALHIVFGESVSEAMSTLGEKNSGNNHSMRDMTLKALGNQIFRTNSTGFRFAKIEAKGSVIMLGTVQAFLEMRDLEYKGSFESSDELINSIWMTGAYTVHLNMQEYLWDGIKRDRLVWIGDMHPEVSTISKVFGNIDVVNKSLDLIRDATPIGSWMNGIPSYTMWWFVIQFDWYMYTGDISYLNEQKTYLFETVRNVLDMINDDGTHHFDYTFVEWSSYTSKEEAAGFQAMLVTGLSAASKLCIILENRELYERCVKLVEKVRKHSYEYRGNKQIAAMQAITGIVDPKLVSEEVLKPGLGRGLSSFWGYYTLKALAKSGDINAALEIIRQYWGGMLKMGATTFWEDFDIDWMENAAPIDEIVLPGKKDIHGDFGRFCYTQFRHSLCHGWASGPTAFLSEYVLGVKILEPGCKKVMIKAPECELKWVKGVYPTPYGGIEIEHFFDGSETKTNIKTPDEVTVVR